jgi:hypothetical protein
MCHSVGLVAVAKRIKSHYFPCQELNPGHPGRSLDSMLTELSRLFANRIKYSIICEENTLGDLREKRESDIQIWSTPFSLNSLFVILYALLVSLLVQSVEMGVYCSGINGTIDIKLLGDMQTVP